LVFPARGTAALWGEQATVPRPDALTALVGRARARLLLAQTRPAGRSVLYRRTPLGEALVAGSG
jgi:hypothetical protein